MTAFVLRLLASAVMRYRRRALLAIALVILAKVAAVGVPLTLKAIIDQLGSMPASVVLPVFLVVAYTVLRFLGTFFNEVRDMIFVRVTQSTESRFLLDVFAHMHRMSSRFHGYRRMGSASRDIERGTAGIGFLMGVGLFTLLPTLVEIIGVIAVMSFNYSGWFSVAILVTFVAYSTFTVAFTERRTIYQRALNELDSSANSHLVDSLLNHETVKYYSAEAFEYRHFRNLLRQWVEVGVKNQKALSTLHLGQSGIIAVGVASVMLLATQNVVHGTMSVGDLVLVNAYVIQICLPLNSLGFIFREARDAVVNAEQMLRLLEQQPEIQDRPEAPELVVTRGEVRFEHVDFAYDPSRQILTDVDFSIPPGGTVAVVGSSGSGKSTLARLLFRFHDVGAGRITIDGTDIRDVSQHSLRNALGIVPQDTTLFNGSIAYNIGYSRPGATPAEIVEAAKAAHLHDFIASLPAQYETEVGERGILLPAGEKQRLAIARAILRNPPIMVFDEADSALDSRSEGAIQDELGRLARARTTLLIAQRLSSVVDADEILVLEHGRIVERGRHHELLGRDGLYARLWRLQRQRREVESSERDMSMQPVNLGELLDGVVDGLKATIDARDVSFRTALHASSTAIAGDPGRLRQILWTLVEHAVLATALGGQVIGRIERDAGWLRLSLRNWPATQPVSDNGFDAQEIRTNVEQIGGHFDVRADSGEVRLEFPLSLAAQTREAVEPTASVLLETRSE